MKRVFYKMWMASDDGWVLSPKDRFDDGGEINFKAYWHCERISDLRPVPFKVAAVGRPVDFNPTSFPMSVVSYRMADVIASLAPGDVQRIAAQVDGQQDGDWEILNVLAIADCIDHERSIIQYCPIDDPDRPGEPRGVVKLVIDPDRTDGHQIFHAKGWRVAIIVSEKIKDALDAIGASGLRYTQVTE